MQDLDDLRQDLLGEARTIVDNFEQVDNIIYDERWEEYGELIALYLAAKKFIQRYG